MGGGGKAPQVQYEPEETEEQKKKTKKVRTALLGTEGGILGQELAGDQVKGRNTLLGN